MNKNEWIKKYLEEYNEKKGTDKAEKDLTDREKAVAQALYEKYQKESLAEQEQELKKTEKVQNEENAKKEASQKSSVIEKGVKEDLLLRGNNKVGAEEKIKTRANTLKASEVDSLDKGLKKELEEDEEVLSNSLRKYKEENEQKIDKINNTYDKKEEIAYNKALEEMEKIKESKWVKDLLYQRGTKEELKSYIDNHRGELGERYDELLEQINRLEEYAIDVSPSQKVEFKVGDTTVILSEKEYSLANAVQYKKDAGLIVTYADNFVVSYNGIDYKIQGGNKIDGDLLNIVLKLGNTRNNGLKVGDVIYYKDKLYVYAGNDVIRECKNRGKNTRADSLDALLKVLFIEKQRVVENDEE